MHTLYKVFLEVTNLEATCIVEVNKLCYRLEAGIEAKIYLMILLYKNIIIITFRVFYYWIPIIPSTKAIERS